MRNSLIYTVLLALGIGISVQSCQDENSLDYKRYYVNGKRIYENVMGTPEQNKAAQERMDKSKGKKAGGVIKSSASKRADGCAIRGKTRA
jgi:hypothetical protein